MGQSISIPETASFDRARSRAERERLLRVAAAACLLLRELDGDTFETFESAELLAHCLGGLPEETVREAMALCSVM
jgi:hypothetical protein